MTLQHEDRIGLAVAIVLHLLLVVALAIQFLFIRDAPLMPERVTVSLASEVSLAATAPDPSEESSAAIAPVLSDEPAQVVEPAPAETTPEPSPPVTETRQTAPTRSAPTRDRSRPDRPPETAPTRTAENTGGGSRIGDDFLPGQGSSTTSDNQSAPAPTFGRAERAALASAITRQLRRHWTAPNGVDADKLVSIVRWQLNQDGSLRGRPTCTTRQSSITQSNRPQAGIHCERAINAVRKAAPFNLPEQFYTRWDDLEWQFDRRL